ncbi:hypothetical protein SUGI_0662720 [Cryptomeria japonica]|nr:hypothetical protein SUGI_0662720 [Cryptomeria japonica]
MERLADSSDSFLRMFSYMELKIATSIFRSKLGSGGFGTVFKGHLIDGTLVAVKKMEGSRQDEKQFQAEISSLGNIQHANLIRLRGFYAEGSRRFLIYDYMANGSLNSLLFTSNSKNKRKDEEVKPSMRQAVLMLEGKMQPQVQQIRSSMLVDNKTDQSDTDSDGDVTR